MGNATRAETLAPDHVRIESTLDWYFNFADADLGLRSNHAATVAFLNNPEERTVASDYAAEDAMFRAVEAIRRFRAVSEVVNRLSKRDQRNLQQSYTARRWSRELASRPAAQRWFAASSPSVRALLLGQGHKQWTLGAAERLLVLAERAARGTDELELEGVRVEAWTFAERALDALLGRYGVVESAVAIEAAAAQAERRTRAKAVAPSHGGDANPRRWS